MREEEEEAVITNGMNDDNICTINSCADFDNNRIGEDNCNINQIKVWGTWEELVLTYAVKRHAFTDWDSIAKKVQLRSRSSLIASAVNCRLKYEDLKRRFQDSVDGGKGNSEEAVEDEVGEVPWLEQLRSLHVAELRREVQRCDDSILSLQLKVKKLEEEKAGNDGDNKPDLGNDETKPVRLNRETTESDRDNRSINESNSTASVDEIADHERLGGDKIANPDPVYKAASEKEEITVSRRSKMSQSGELDESGTSKVPRKRKGRNYKSGDDSSIRGGSGGDIKSAGNKSQPLIDIIKLIRSHPRGSVFESRLRSQETKDYKSLIRQHLNIKTIEKKMEKGSYVSSSLSFYRDLKLLFTNAIVFFPTSSSESMAAHELRTLVSNEIKKRTGNLDHGVIKAEAESSVSKQKSSVLSLVACKKKISTSKKTSPSSSFKQKDEKKSQEVSEEKTATTSGARSSRRMSKGTAVVAKDTKTERAKNNNKKQTDTKAESSNDDDDDDDEKEETPKTEKKTRAAASDKKKSVADFLKRIKKNSPQKGKETASKTQKKSNGNVKKENDNQKKSVGNVKKENKNQKKNVGNVKKENSKAKPRELRSNSTGKKKVEVENNNTKSSSKRKQQKETAEATGKRGRESGKDDKQPKKRSRR